MVPIRAAIAESVEHVILVSSMGTTTPNSFLDKLGDGHALFYKLQGGWWGYKTLPKIGGTCFRSSFANNNVKEYFCCGTLGEADLMASGLAFTIVKPGGLLSTKGGKALLLAGHDDDMEHARCDHRWSRSTWPSHPGSLLIIDS